MSGICGFLNADFDIKNIYADSLLNENVEVKGDFKDSFVNIAQTGLKFLNIKPKITDGLCLFVDGCIFNTEQLQDEFSFDFDDFNQILIESYKRGIIKEVLKKINGQFCACLYDSTKKKIFLITDKMRNKNLFYYFKDNFFAFAFDVNTILSIDFIDKTFNLDSFNCFIETPAGFLVEDNTYFKYIKLMAPASVLEFDINSQTITQEYYWKYSEIKQIDMTYEDAIDKLHEIFVSAVKRNFRNIKPEDMNLPLSGGLDSRLILAELYKQNIIPAEIWTMGDKNSLDVRIAQKVCRKFNLKHTVYDIKLIDWFGERIKYIWHTNGMLSVLDMHGCEMPFCNKYILSGYSGDAILGGTFKKNEKILDRKADEKSAYDFYKSAVKYCNFDNDFYNTPHLEPHIYMNRVGRFTQNGIIIMNQNNFSLMPFMDNELLEFIFSIPDRYRLKNHLYEDFLLKYYPEFFKDIPWQKTAMPISGYKILNDKNPFVKIETFKFLNEKSKNLLGKLAKKFNPNVLFYDQRFFDYEKMVDLNKYVSQYLNNNCIIRKLLGNHPVDNYIEQNNFRYIFKLITQEIYLNQLKDKGYLIENEKII